MKKKWFLVLVVWMNIALFTLVNAQVETTSRLVHVAEGFAQTSVNAVIFRKNSISSFGDFQYIAFYNNSGSVVLARRKLGSDDWEINQTHYKGNVKDAQ